ncbi:hypothetical protein [Nostoc sp.]|uniref:hypothetical protein n=1 Tax=Nostoc sp. TaxID=1180 RepID=UPI002FF27ADD
MSKPRKKQGNPDFRHRVTALALQSKEIESSQPRAMSTTGYACPKCCRTVNT